jgi:hypothetical protein
MAEADDHQDRRHTEDPEQGLGDDGEGAGSPCPVSGLLRVSGEGLRQLCRLPLCEDRMIGPGRRGDCRRGVALRMTGFGILGRREGSEMCRAHGIVDLMLDLGAVHGGERAFAAGKHRGQAIERVSPVMPQTGSGQTPGDGTKTVTTVGRDRQFGLREPIPPRHRAAPRGQGGMAGPSHRRRRRKPRAHR